MSTAARPAGSDIASASATAKLAVLVEVETRETIELLCEAHLLDPRADFHSREDIGAAIRFLVLARRA